MSDLQSVQAPRRLRSRRSLVVGQASSGEVRPGTNPSAARQARPRAARSGRPRGGPHEVRNSRERITKAFKRHAGCAPGRSLVVGQASSGEIRPGTKPTEGRQARPRAARSGRPRGGPHEVRNSRERITKAFKRHAGCAPGRSLVVGQASSGEIRPGTKPTEGRQARPRAARSGRPRGGPHEVRNSRERNQGSSSVSQ